MKSLFSIFALFLSLFLSLTAEASINAWLDQNQIAQGETVQLSLQHEGQTDSLPELDSLKKDFDLIRSNSGTNIQIVNGKVTAKVQFNLVLLPKHAGKIQIPALQWDGQTSSVLTLMVSGHDVEVQPGKSPSSKALSGDEAHVFIKLIKDQKPIYVQTALLLVVKLYTDLPLYQASLEFPEKNDVLFEQLGQDRQTREDRNGKNYQVIERKYLLFPQRSGQIKLDGPVLNAQIQTGGNTDLFENNPFFGNLLGLNPFSGRLNSSRPIRVQGDKITVSVRPRPAEASSHEWLPAERLTVEETWQPAKGPFRTGEPITRHLRLSAEGLSATQLPDLSLLMQLPAGMRAYPSQPGLGNVQQGNNVIGTREQNIAIVADHVGHFEIPALHLFWWDTGKDRQQEILLPARSLDILPSAGGVAVATIPPDQESGGNLSSANPGLSENEDHSSNKQFRWNWLGFALAVLWLGTLAIQISRSFHRSGFSRATRNLGMSAE